MLEISVNEAATSPMPRQTQRTARRGGEVFMSRLTELTHPPWARQ